MKQHLIARYDGEALRPEGPVQLETDAQYAVTVEELEAAPGRINPAIARIIKRARDLGVSDLAAQHDHYLYGLPKR